MPKKSRCVKSNLWEAGKEFGSEAGVAAAVVPLVGLETSDASSLSTNDLRQSAESGAAKADAVSLDAIIAMLAALSPEDRARLAATLTGHGQGG